MLAVAAFTGGENVPSARFRVRQYAGLLRGYDIDLVEHCARFGAYPPNARLLRPAWAALSLAQRVPSVLGSRRADVTLLQRSLLSTYVTLEGWTNQPRVLDVDDAIWAHPRGAFAAHLAALCDSVVCGNNYLAEHFAQWNPRIEVIATGVDAQRFRPLPEPSTGERLTIGWSGSHGGLVQLQALEPVLARVLNAFPLCTLLVTSNRPPHLPYLPPGQVEYLPWSPQNEVETLQRMDVGLMPLEDNEWTRGKCSYKMLLYMACAKPVIVSPVGMNREVLAMADVGIGADGLDSWTAALHDLLTQPELRRSMGESGRKLIEERFDLPVTGRALANHLLACKGS